MRHAQIHRNIRRKRAKNTAISNIHYATTNVEKKYNNRYVAIDKSIIKPTLTFKRLWFCIFFSHFVSFFCSGQLSFTCVVRVIDAQIEIDDDDDDDDDVDDDGACLGTVRWRAWRWVRGRKTATTTKDGTTRSNRPSLPIHGIPQVPRLRRVPCTTSPWRRSVRKCLPTPEVVFRLQELLPA